MLSILKSQVPTYLHDSEFYDSLSKEGELLIDPAHLKFDQTINTHRDLHHLLSTVRFWGKRYICDSLVAYCLKASMQVLTGALSAFPELLFLTHLQTVAQATPEARMSKAIASGTVEIVSYLHRSGYTWDASQCSEAALHGHFACLKFAHENGCPWSDQTAEFACRGLSFSCLKYAIEHGCPMSSSAMWEATQLGQLDMVMYLRSHGCEWDCSTTTCAAAMGHLHVLQYLHEQGCPWDVSLPCEACLHDQLACLEYAYSQGCPCYSSATIASAAALGGNLHILVHLRNHNCPWDEEVYLRAVRHDHLAIVQYAHEQGLPWTSRTFVSAVRSGSISSVRYLHEHGCPYQEHELREKVLECDISVHWYLVEVMGIKMQPKKARIRYPSYALYH